MLTVTAPEDPFATTARTVVEEINVVEPDWVPPKFTFIPPVKFVPVIVITVPGPPVVGLKEVIVGRYVCMNPVIETRSKTNTEDLKTIEQTILFNRAAGLIYS